MKLSVSSTLKQAWKLVSGSKLTFYRLLLVAAVFKIINMLGEPENIQAMVNVYHWQWLKSDAFYFASLLLVLAAFFGYVFLLLAQRYIAMKRVYGSEIHFRMFKDVISFKLLMRTLFAYFLVVLIIGLITAAGFVLIVLGGYIPVLIGKTAIAKFLVALTYLIFLTAMVVSMIYVALRLFLVTYILLAPCMGEETVSAVQSLELSWRYTRGQTLYIFLLILSNGLLIILSLVLLLVGYLWTLPLTHISEALAYKQLREKYEGTTI